jgi:hypothetical protein
MKISELKQLIIKEINQSKVNNSYDKIIDLLKKEARKLSDDDAFELHEKLKKFFNKLI